jgi:hypothetical protein
MPGRDEQFAAMATDLGVRARRDQQRAEQNQYALEEALHHPHSVEEISVSATGVADAGPMLRQLIIAIPSGHQTRLNLTPQASRTLAEALAAPFKGESEQSAEASGS